MTLVKPSSRLADAKSRALALAAATNKSGLELRKLELEVQQMATPKSELERRKLELEVEQLAAPWYRRPSFVLAALPTLLAVLSVIYGFANGYFQSVAVRMENERHDLKRDIEAFKAERKNIEKEIAEAREALVAANKAASSAERNARAAQARADVSYPSLLALRARSTLKRVKDCGIADTEAMFMPIWPSKKYKQKDGEEVFPSSSVECVRTAQSNEDNYRGLAGADAKKIRDHIERGLTFLREKRKLAVAAYDDRKFAEVFWSGIGGVGQFVAPTKDVGESAPDEVANEKLYKRYIAFQYLKAYRKAISGLAEMAPDDS